MLTPNKEERIPLAGDAVVLEKTSVRINQGGSWREEFKKEAANILAARLPFSILFAPSRLVDGAVISGGAPVKDGEGFFTMEIAGGKSVVVEVEKDRVANLYLPDGKLNEDVLTACFAKLEQTPCVSLCEESQANLDKNHKGTTGRDRLLDFMNLSIRESKKRR